MKSTSRRGFTLIELLVLVSLIAILAALFFPFFARRHESSAYRSSCQNNLKQIVLACKQYLNDFDERYPLVFVTNVGSTSYAPPFGWADALQPYLKNTQVMQCPNEASEGQNNSSQPSFSDYWYNANFIVKIKDKKGVVRFLGANESAFGSSTQTIMAGDGGNAAGNPTGDARYNHCGDGNSLTGRGQICPAMPETYATLPSADLHLEGCNFAFADGHVKWLKSINSSQSEQVLNNGATPKTIGGKVTFSLLTT
jgi:prepilin-type processing-associated H-X9-DG protein/prepilin-type N-terminal cleavage/methylation domain-containing protein